VNAIKLANQCTEYANSFTICESGHNFDNLPVDDIKTLVLLFGFGNFAFVVLARHGLRMSIALCHKAEQENYVVDGKRQIAIRVYQKY
jgi:hypothetical protein